jgi:hypothetical protein
VIIVPPVNSTVPAPSVNQSSPAPSTTAPTTPTGIRTIGVPPGYSPSGSGSDSLVVSFFGLVLLVFCCL